MSSRDTLSREDLYRAWRLAYRCSLDELPDSEIAWERDTWRDQGMPSIAAVCDDLLAERRQTQTAIPGGADGPDLDRLLACVAPGPVFRLVRDEGLCLVAAVRLVFWSGLRETRR